VVAALLTPQVRSCEKATFFASFFFARKERRDPNLKLSDFRVFVLVLD